MHTASTQKILSDSSQYNLCISCHDGSGADTDVSNGVYLGTAAGTQNAGLRGGGFDYALMNTSVNASFNATGTPVAVTSDHAAGSSSLIAWGSGSSGSGETIGLECGNCHNPHGNASYRLLRPKPTSLSAWEGLTPVVVPDEAAKGYTVTYDSDDYREIGSYDSGIRTTIADWCSQCHTRYLASSGSGSADSGDATFKYRHITTGIYGGCFKCHVAHGSTASMAARSGEVDWPDDSPGEGAGDSRLLNIDNRGVCASCHLDNDGAVSGGNCTGCHSMPQGEQQAIDMNAFEISSHQETGCTGCHAESDNHMDGLMQLSAGSSNPTITETAGGALEVDDFCYQCHTDGGVVNWGVAGYEGTHDGGNNLSQMIDGTANFQTANFNLNGWKIYNTTDGSLGTISTHDATTVTATLSGGTDNDWDNGDDYHIALVDDIEQAFGLSRKHDLGSSFTVSGTTYTLQCSTCHNPHVVTGKHWDVNSGVSPVTRPDLTADNTTNPRAMGSEIWGDQPGEKMDDYAALASGSGGWYYSQARGGVISNDQPAVYRPPKTGSGYRSEFDGDILPDYVTFCQDCHSSDMGGGTQGAINWSGDPYRHGLPSANQPSYISDEGTAGFWGTNGNPDVLFNMNYVTRGRGAGHFMRWPYDSADKNAGINFVMSCTDCHESHGAGAPSMLRPTVNNYTPGTNIWNTFCNGCHYYYGGQHTGMSCASAAGCHPHNAQTSIHRGGGTGSGGTRLQITATGWEGSYVRPDFTPEIETVYGNIGSYDLLVTLRTSDYGSGVPGVYTNQDLSGALGPEDFWLIDGNSNNAGRTISVTHTAGETTASITMSQPLVEADLSTDLLALGPASVWAWYQGGYENWATGTIPAQAVSAGPWPVAVTSDFAITKVEGVVDSDKLYLEFSKGAYTSANGTGDLQVSDFSYTNISGNGAASITAIAHTAGDSTAIITVNTTLVAGDIDTDTVAAVAGAIYDADGYPLPANAMTITALAEPPLMTVVLGADGHQKLALWFSERVYANSDASGALRPADFDASGLGKNIIAVEHTPGAVTATLTLDGNISSGDIGSVTLAAEGTSIYDIAGYLAPVTPVTLTADTVYTSSIAQVEGITGSNKLKVTFQSQVYANPDETGNLTSADFSFTDGNGGGAASISSVSHAAGSPIAVITVNTDLISGDIGSDNLKVVSNSIFGPSAGNFPLGTDTVTVTTQAAPAIDRVEGVVGYNQLLVAFSQGVYAADNGTGDLLPGDFTYANNGGGGATAISSVKHTAGSSTAIITLDAVLIPGDTGSDTVAANGVFNSIANPVGTTPVAITATDWPVWGTTFWIEDEPQHSATTNDETGLLTGTVGNPTFAFPDVDNDWFNGDEGEGTYINISNTASLQSPRALTIEALVKPTVVDGGIINEFNRIFERRRTLLVTIVNTDYRGDDIPSRANKASIEVKYRVENSFGAGGRHHAPHPQWPADPYAGPNDVRMHQISSSIDDFPIVNDHWYLIRVVFNSDKSDVPGSDGTPVDIFIDDLGPDGDNIGQRWNGYKNATRGINGSSSSKWGALPGDVINYRNDTSHIGSNYANSAQQFDGQINWLSWKPYADYSGVDDSPR